MIGTTTVRYIVYSLLVQFFVFEFHDFPSQQTQKSLKPLIFVGFRQNGRCTLHHYDTHTTNCELGTTAAIATVEAIVNDSED